MSDNLKTELIPEAYIMLNLLILDSEPTSKWDSELSDNGNLSSEE